MEDQLLDAIPINDESVEADSQAEAGPNQTEDMDIDMETSEDEEPTPTPEEPEEPEQPEPPLGEQPEEPEPPIAEQPEEPEEPEQPEPPVGEQPEEPEEPEQPEPPVGEQPEQPEEPEQPEPPVGEQPEEPEQPEPPVGEQPEEPEEPEQPEPPVDEQPEEPEEPDEGGGQPNVSFGTIGDDDFSEIDVPDAVPGDSSILFTGAGNDFINTVGNPLSNTVYAGSGDDILIAGNEDRFFGQAGDDQFFITDQGDNILNGGAGTDTFNLANAELPSGINTVSDFTQGEDIIGINGFEDLTFEDLSLTQSENDTILGLSGQDFATLSGVEADTLEADDFVFG